jgi:kinetochore protein Spc25, fungi type
MATMSTSSFTPSHPFSTSTSSRAAVAPTSPQPNPLTQLPNVDFNFEDLRQRMSAFTVKFDAFIERGRKRVLEERNEFRGRLGELAGALSSFPFPSFSTYLQPAFPNPI